MLTASSNLFQQLRTTAANILVNRFTLRHYFVNNMLSQFSSDPCENITCANHGVCKRDANSIRGYRCECRQCTDFENTLVVCGSDHKTYRSECELKRESCRRNRYITVRYFGRCGKFINLRFSRVSSDSVDSPQISFR